MYDIHDINNKKWSIFLLMTAICCLPFLSIGQCPTISSSTTMLNQVSCFGGSDGGATVSASDGASPYQFQWDNGETGTTAIALNSGLHYVFITDDNNCEVLDSVIITEPLELTVNISFGLGESCDLCDAPVQISFSGGTAPYSYIWEETSMGTVMPGPITNLCTGIYSLTVTDLNNCMKTEVFSVEDLIHIESAISNITPACNNCDGSIDIDVSSTSQLSFLWSHGVTTEDVDQLCAGTYTVTIENSDGCSSILSATIDGISASFIVNNNIDCEDNSASATINVSGGTPPYLYLWDNAETGSMVTFLSGGIRVVTVTDADGCYANYSANIDIPDPLEIEIMFLLGESCNLCDAPIGITPIGGSPPYLYSWTSTNGDSGTSPAGIPQICTGYYYLTITDADACTATAEFNAEDEIHLEVNPTILPSCGNCDGSIVLDAFNIGQTPYPLVFEWSNGQTGPVLDQLCPGNYTLSITTYDQCDSTMTFTVADGNCMWPGDANYDGIADNNDIIALGIAYGGTGPTRANATLDWIPQDSDDWTNSLPSGPNYRHCDSDGDGLIDYPDTLAVSLNYGKPAHPLFAKLGSTDGPELYFEFDRDTLQGGDTLKIDILYGNGSQMVQQVYGLAFSVVYDGSLIQTGLGAADFSDSWVGTPSEIITLAKEFDGFTDFGIARIDQSNVDGSGKIATLSLVIQDNIDGLQLKSNNSLGFSFTDVTILDVGENPIDFSPIASEIPIQSDPTVGIPFLPKNAVKIFPNPAQTWVQVDAVRQNIDAVVLYNLLGEVVLEQRSIGGSSIQLNTRALPMGSYFIKVLTKEGQVNEVLILGVGGR